ERAVASGELVAVTEQSEEGAEMRSWLVLPLGRGSERLGCLGVVSRSPAPFAAEDREFFALVGERVALALDVARRAADLRRMAFHDELTGLPNRAFFGDRLEEALAHAARDKATVALLYLDLDNFRMINESLGHPAGDGMLTEVASRLTACVESDAGLSSRTTVARLSGDEFTIVVDASDTDEALGLAQRLNTA